MLKVMLDTNILVRLAFVKNKLSLKKQLPRNLTKYEFILQKLENAEFLNVMSSWNKLELRDVLMRLKLAEIFFLSGFSVDEFRDAKGEKIELSEEDKKVVNDVVFEIWKFCKRSTAVEMSNRKIEHWTKKGYSTMDIILIHQAELHKCDYFVTTDAQLYTSDELGESFNIKICHVNDFKNKIHSFIVSESKKKKSKPYIKKKALLDALSYFKERKSTIEWNIEHNEKALRKRERLGKERGIKEPQIIPDGYWDEDKHLKEGIEISKKQLKECEEEIENIHKLSKLN